MFVAHILPSTTSVSTQQPTQPAGSTVLPMIVNSVFQGAVPPLAHVITTGDQFYEFQPVAERTFIVSGRLTTTAWRRGALLLGWLSHQGFDGSVWQATEHSTRNSNNPARAGRTSSSVILLHQGPAIAIMKARTLFPQLFYSSPSNPFSKSLKQLLYNVDVVSFLKEMGITVDSIPGPIIEVQTKKTVVQVPNPPEARLNEVNEDEVAEELVVEKVDKVGAAQEAAILNLHLGELPQEIQIVPRGNPTGQQTYLVANRSAQFLWKKGQLLATWGPHIGFDGCIWRAEEDAWVKYNTHVGLAVPQSRVTCVHQGSIILLAEARKLFPHLFNKLHNGAPGSLCSHVLVDGDDVSLYLRRVGVSTSNKLGVGQQIKSNGHVPLAPSPSPQDDRSTLDVSVAEIPPHSPQAPVNNEPRWYRKALREIELELQKEGLNYIRRPEIVLASGSVDEKVEEVTSDFLLWPTVDNPFVCLVTLNATHEPLAPQWRTEHQMLVLNYSRAQVLYPRKLAQQILRDWAFAAWCLSEKGPRPEPS